MHFSLLTAAVGLLAVVADAAALEPRTGGGNPAPPKQHRYVCPTNDRGPLCCTGVADAVGARSGCNSIPPGTQCENGAATPVCCFLLVGQIATGCTDASIQYY